MNTPTQRRHGGGRKSTSTGPLLKYLEQNLGLPVHMDDIIKTTGLSKTQVQSSLYHLRERRGMNVETLVAGQVYMLRSFERTPPPAAPEPVKRALKRMFEELGVTRKGEVIAQDEDGVLYRVEEL